MIINPEFKSSVYIGVFTNIACLTFACTASSALIRNLALNILGNSCLHFFKGIVFANGPEFRRLKFEFRESYIRDNKLDPDGYLVCTHSNVIYALIHTLAFSHYCAIAGTIEIVLCRFPFPKLKKLLLKEILSTKFFVSILTRSFSKIFFLWNKTKIIKEFEEISYLGYASRTFREYRKKSEQIGTASGILSLMMLITMRTGLIRSPFSKYI